MVGIIRTVKSKRGQALVETALVLPILLLVLMGIVEFGRIFNSYIIVTNASREGARYASIHSTDTEIKSAVTNLTQTLNQSKVTISITPNQSSRVSGSSATVKVDYDLEIIAPFINTIIGNPFRVSAQTVMRVE